MLHRFLLVGVMLSCQMLPRPQDRAARWRFVPAAANISSLAHSSCGSIDGRFVAFGGIDEAKGSPLNNQLTLYDEGSKRWQALTHADGPVPRNYAAFAVYDRSVYIVGGETAQSPAHADAFSFDLDGQKWERLPQETKLQPRRQATLTRVGQQLVLFGGQGAAEPTSWARYDVPHKLWHVHASSPIMRARVSHVAVSLDTRRIMVWGGFVGQQRQGDGFILDVLGQEVRALPATPHLSARANARALYINGLVFIWGGATSDGKDNSGAVFDIKSESWQSLPAIPDPRFASLKGAEIAPWGPQGFVVFGGRFGTDAFNHELWFFESEGQTWSRIPTLDHPPGRVAHCLVSLAPNRLGVFGGIGYAEGTRTLTQFDGLWILEE
ncbi:MAG TPA: kelch repeat-containing protein [Oligoflexus sp.]|uniref:Kelch repeat-containing protein n=1 Tax=Oligoflexus sp. TaxID=1971216 RepID=UPI002D4A78D8|nr:kelch repeat-containing protein [Oligoflexus sp.]HYX36586.1 kelch repeat-containing protein [Oligoflexus sp.]